jgi:hypothetical protein
MRISFCYTFGCVLLLLSAGRAFGQDTNFATGPQYLTQAPGQFARSISTPSLSLAGPPLEVGASNATGDLTPGAGNQNVLPPNPDALPKVDFFPIFYGPSPVNVVGVNSPSESPSNPLPAGVIDTGVGQLTSTQALRYRGYGVTLAEATTQVKARTRHASRVYTNADIDRLNGGS